MPATDLMSRLPPSTLGGARVFRAFGNYKRGDTISGDDLRRIPPANLRALQDQRFIVTWPADVGLNAPTLSAQVDPPEVHVYLRAGTNRYDVVVGKRLNAAPLGKADAERLADLHRPPVPT